MYALGCLLFWLLSGRTPFEGDDRLAVGLRRAHETAPSLLSCVPDAPPEAAALVDALLAPDPGDRPTCGRGRSSGSVPQCRRSDRRSPTRSRPPSGRRPSSPSRSTTAALEPPRRHAGPQAPPWPPDGARRGRHRSRGRARLRRRDDRERRSRRRGAEGHGHDRAAGARRARRGCPRRSGGRSARDRRPLVLGVRAGGARDLAVACASGRASSGRISTSCSASAGARRARSCPTSRAPHGARPPQRCAAPASPSACAPRSRGRSPRAA